MMPADFAEATHQHLGLVRGLSNEAYHLGPGLGHSQLRDFARSPFHFWKLHRAAARPAPEPSDSMRAGTLAHCLILEPGEFPFRYAVGPEAHGNSKAWKDAEVAAGARELLKPTQLAVATAQAAAVRAHPDAAQFLGTGEAEVSAYWRDEATGLLCRCRPDFIHPGGPGDILVDVKTCPDASPEGFQRAVGTFQYHWQQHFYSEGWTAASGRPVTGFVFIVVEQKYPYAVGVYVLDEPTMAVARAEVAPLMEHFAECNARDEWPGYAPPGALAEIGLPRWYQPRYTSLGPYGGQS